jgi:hypothetical protein
VFCSHRSRGRGAQTCRAANSKFPIISSKELAAGAAEFDRRSIPRKKNRKKRFLLAQDKLVLPLLNWIYESGLPPDPNSGTLNTKCRC